MTWGEVLAEWSSVELDLHDTFGIDAESGIFRERSWRWLYHRIIDRVSDPSSRIGAQVTTPE